MTTTTRERVPKHTSEEINRRIQADIAANVRRLAGHPKLIEERLRELDREWDIERAIEANASALALGGVVLGATVNRRWLALPGLVAAFLFQHAIQGWCPPVPVLRRLGFRTSHEIEQERAALKALRGDFDEVAEAKDRTAAALRAAEVGSG
jgi:hypothetical protein